MRCGDEKTHIQLTKLNCDQQVSCTLYEFDVNQSTEEIRGSTFMWFNLYLIYKHTLSMSTKSKETELRHKVSFDYRECLYICILISHKHEPKQQQQHLSCYKAGINQS